MSVALAPAAFAGRSLVCRRGEKLVFRDLDFDLAPGGVLLLRGPNGSGKSSLLRLMAGLSKPAGGELTWAKAAVGTDMEAHRRRLAFLGHLDGIKSGLSAGENLAFWCGRPAVAPALGARGIEYLDGLPARFLSAGQRRRLALARILARHVPLWLLDEPTNALDDEAEGLFAAALAHHRAEGGMAVIASHAEGAPPAPTVLVLGAHAPVEDAESQWST